MKRKQSIKTPSFAKKNKIKTNRNSFGSRYFISSLACHNFKEMTDNLSFALERAGEKPP